jgi:hypothetical protein
MVCDAPKIQIARQHEQATAGAQFRQKAYRPCQPDILASAPPDFVQGGVLRRCSFGIRAGSPKVAKGEIPP